MIKVIFIHLLNDNSGSPKVLKETIAAVHSDKNHAKLFLGSSGDGILSNCGIHITRYWYRRTRYRILTLFTYLLSQVVLFCKLLSDRTIDENALIYINTLLPFGAALYGKMTGRKVIYHVHESSITPALLKYLLTTIARDTSSLNIYVSDAHMQALPIPEVRAQRVYNALDADFIANARQATYMHYHDGYFNILMIASLRNYKGVPEFVALADALNDQADIRFILVVNDDKETIKRYFFGQDLPPNLTVHPRTTDTVKYYRMSSLVLNLSRVDQCVETFGMTILEAMTFGIPVLVPPVGGPSELVTDCVQGFLIDSRNIGLLREKVLLLFNNQDVCMRMSDECRKRSTYFVLDRFVESVRGAIGEV